MKSLARVIIKRISKALFYTKNPTKVRIQLNGHMKNYWESSNCINKRISSFQLFSEKQQISDSYQTVELDSPDIPDQFQIIDRDTFVKKQALESFRITDTISLIPFEKTITCKQMYFFIDENIELQFDISPFFILITIKSHSRRRWHSRFLFKNHCIPNSTSPYGAESQENSPGLYPTQKLLSAAFPEYIIPSFPYYDIYDNDILMKEQNNVVKVLNVFLQIYNKKPIVKTISLSLFFLNENNSKQFQQKFYKQNNSEVKEYQGYLNGEQGNYNVIQKYLEQFAEFTYKGQQSLGYSMQMIQQLCNLFHHIMKLKNLENHYV
ncbi:unnamed protein product [Paramecium octaurelia]|uniref:Uncharacterized protein n=1 Tax=Paramecium octaurelia TaxID=43137 RepID=A0A8S1YM92_PAROT|nr:unnamed protein product [Paramecium octaurelia]